MIFQFTGHAFKRMVERKISPADVKETVLSGIVLTEYPDDTPNPSRLLMHIINGRPIHVVASYNKEADSEIIITAYEPDREIWSNDFTTRRK